ncbi:MAG TPA: protein kinase [Candidatus Angelobacter sp.]|nr:protein kinase [Candidatus Angelobacter sp.]
MDPLPVTPKPLKESQQTGDRTTALVLTALSVRLFAFGGAQGKLRNLSWQPEDAVTALLRSLVQDSQGRISQIAESTLLAHFEGPAQALATARALQQKLLTFHREGSQEQVVAAAVVHGWGPAGLKAWPENSPANSPDAMPATVLVEPGPAQVLVTEKIHDAMKSVPGFEFNALPVRGPGETGTAESFYELLWADGSTYANLRRAIHDAGLNMTRKSRYEIQSELGRGAMGVVYKAYDQMIGRTVALKTITVDRNSRDHDSLVERLKQEAKAAGGLDHPNIITIFDVGEEDNQVYLSMQFVEGVTLGSLIADDKLPPLPALLIYADQICSAVGYAHKKGVIHRDLKPANLMLTPLGGIKVLDFGIAKLGDTGLTQAGMVIGTPTYMAPEQAIGKKVDQRSDIFALGAVFYELFTRERPFRGEITTIFYKLLNEDATPPSQINPALPPGIDAIIRKALAKEPEKRFQTCEELRQALAEQAALLAKAGTQTTARVTAPARPLIEVPSHAPIVTPRPKPKRTSRAWIYVALVVCIAAAAVVLGLRVARIKAAMYAFQHPNQVNEAPAQSTASTTPPSSDAQTGVQSKRSPAGSEPGNTQTAPATDASNTSNTQPVAAQTVDAKTTGDAAGTKSDQELNEAAKAPDAGTSAAEPQPRQDTAKPRKRVREAATEPEPANNVSVEGFHSSDIPDLLRKADAAAGRGDYAGARYGYSVVLRLDRRNALARAGFLRATEAEKERARQ